MQDVPAPEIPGAPDPGRTAVPGPGPIPPPVGSLEASLWWCKGGAHGCAANSPGTFAMRGIESREMRGRPLGSGTPFAAATEFTVAGGTVSKPGKLAIPGLKGVEFMELNEFVPKSRFQLPRRPANGRLG